MRDDRRVTEPPLDPREVRVVPFERVARAISVALVLVYVALWLRPETLGAVAALSPVVLLGLACVWLPRKLSVGRRTGLFLPHRWAGSPPDLLVWFGLFLVAIPGLVGLVAKLYR